MSEFALCQEEFERIDPAVLAPILERRLGLVRFDAIHAARESCGILAERLDAAHAGALEQDLRAAGFETRQIPQPQVIRIGKPALVRTVAFTSTALQIVMGYTSEPQTIPWGEVRFLSAGIVTDVQVKRVVVAVRKKRKRLNFGRFAADLAAPGLGALLYDVIGKARDKPQGHALKSVVTDVHLVDLFAGALGGECLHVRLKARDLYYDAILGAERTPHYLENFLLVLAKLSTGALHALVSPALRALVESSAGAAKGLEEARFSQELEFTQYNRWQMQMLALEGG